MNGREFLSIARELLRGGTEAHWRSAAGRAYYALFLEARDSLTRWGFAPPPHAQVHHFVRSRLNTPVNPDLRAIGPKFDLLGTLRTKADYRIAVPAEFIDRARAAAAVIDADNAIKRIDQVESDPARRAAVVAALQAAFPP
jgi:hypothetical protein